MLRRILDGTSNVLLVIAAFATGLMAVHIILDVSGRYLLGRPLPATVELVAQYYMVAIVFLPLAQIQRTDGHFVSTMMTDSLSPRRIQILDGITSLLMGAVALLLTWATFEAAQSATASNDQVQATKFVIYSWPPRWLLPLGLLLMAVYAFVNGVRRLLGEDPPPATPGGH